MGISLGVNGLSGERHFNELLVSFYGRAGWYELTRTWAYISER